MQVQKAGPRTEREVSALRGAQIAKLFSLRQSIYHSLATSNKRYSIVTVQVQYSPYKIPPS